MRILLLIAVIALVFDAVKYDGAYTKSALHHVTIATEQLTDRFGDTEHAGKTGSDSEPPAGATRL